MQSVIGCINIFIPPFPGKDIPSVDYGALQVAIEKALTDAESAAQQRRDMESQVEAANKRAQKAKLAAQAALEEL